MKVYLIVLVVTFLVVLLAAFINRSRRSAVGLANTNTLLQSVKVTALKLPASTLTVIIGVWGIFSKNLLPALCETFQIGCNASAAPWFGFVVATIGFLTMLQKNE